MFTLLCVSLLVALPACKNKCCGTKTTHEKKYKKLHKSHETKGHDMVEEYGQEEEETDKE